MLGKNLKKVTNLTQLVKIHRAGCRKITGSFLFSFHVIIYKLFLSIASDRTHIGTYVGVSPSLASNENNNKEFLIVRSRIFYFN